VEGVRSPDLITHINRVVDAYDAFVFWPYESATTLEGISVVAERAIVMPRLNADPLRFARIVRERLRNARAFFVRDEVEHDALVTLLGSDIERHVRVIVPRATARWRGMKRPAPSSTRSSRCRHSMTAGRCSRHSPKSPTSIRWYGVSEA